MAVKAKETLVYEEASSDTEAEEEEEEEELLLLLHNLHNRISQTSYPLSEEAVGVLHEALLCLNTQSMLPSNSLLSPLILQLKSLSTLIPSTQGDEGSTSCVITCALNYLEELMRVIQSLKEGKQEATSLRGGPSKDEFSPIEGHSFCNVDYAGFVKVESESNAKLHILFHCKKREGLLSSLILTLDTLGLVIDKMDISCNDIFMLDAISTQECGSELVVPSLNGNSQQYHENDELELQEERPLTTTDFGDEILEIEEMIAREMWDAVKKKVEEEDDTSSSSDPSFSVLDFTRRQSITHEARRERFSGVIS